MPRDWRADSAWADGSGSFSIPLRNRFDTQGRLTSVKERNGQGLTLSYTGSDLASIEVHGHTLPRILGLAVQFPTD